MDYSLVLVIFHSSSHPFSAFPHSSLYLYRLQVWDLVPLASLSFIQLVAPGGDQEAKRERSQGFSSSLSSCSEAVAACLSLPPSPASPSFLSGSSSTVLALTEFHKIISLPCPFISRDVVLWLASTTLVYPLNGGYPSVSSPFTKVSSFEPSWKKSLSFWDSDRHTLLNIFLTRYCQIALQKGYIQLYFHLQFVKVWWVELLK